MRQPAGCLARLLCRESTRAPGWLAAGAALGSAVRMGKTVIWWAGLALAGVFAAWGPSAAGRAAGGSWGRVIELPGVMALDKGGFSSVDDVSCGSAGNCAAGGHYSRGHDVLQGFVAVERNGRWGKASAVPGLAALNASGYADVAAMSCASASYCAAGGYYGNEGGHDTSGFVAVEKNGVWGKAVTFPGEDGDVDSIFCVSAGNCLAGGSEASDYFYPFQGFVAQERNGRWGPATGVPGLKPLNKGGSADVDTVWCASAGNCVAGGYYEGRTSAEGFMAIERDGAWGTAMPVPGLAALNKGGDAQVSSVSCASSRNCVAGGYYRDKSGKYHGFVAVERNGAWGTAMPVPGLAALNEPGRSTMVLSVSCVPAGRCVAGGFYADRSGHRQGFVTSERNGRWGTPVPMPGLVALNKGGFAEVGALSCPSRGSCAAAGTYTGHSRHQGFVTQPG